MIPACSFVRKFGPCGGDVIYVLSVSRFFPLSSPFFMALIRISILSPSSDAIRNSFVVPPAAGRSWVGLLSVIPVCCVVCVLCSCEGEVIHASPFSP